MKTLEKTEKTHNSTAVHQNQARIRRCPELRRYAAVWKSQQEYESTRCPDCTHGLKAVFNGTNKIEAGC
jgi:hypothetical protein